MSLPKEVGSSVQVDSEGWISWDRGPCRSVGDQLWCHIEKGSL